MNAQRGAVVKMSNQNLQKIARIAASGLGMLACAALFGCATTTAPSAPAPELPAPVVDVNYQEIIPEHAPRATLAEHEDVLPPVLDPEKVIAPEFPAERLSADDLSVQMLARLVIDAEGRVNDVLFDEDAQTDALEPFRDSIRTAALQWKFLPMIIVKAPQPTAKGGMRRQHVPTPVSLWYQFEFTIKNGQPETSIREQPLG